MVRKSFSPALVAAVLLASGCATTPRPAPVDVTRYHLGQPVERTTVTVEPMTSAGPASPEYQLYADAVAQQLERLGYVRSRSDMASGYIAGVSFTRATVGQFRDRPPVSIGLGGGSYSGGYRSGVGLGGGLSFGLGGKKRDVIAAELWVQLRRRSDNTVVWEGRAMTEAVSGVAGSDPRDSAQRLAEALFRDFPGESGVTTTVR